MTNQHWSVVLETISFFFVAIDLYGRERLERMHLNMVAGGQKLSSVLDRIQTYSWRKDKNRVIIAAVYGVAIVPTAIVFLDTFPSEQFENGVTIGDIPFLVFIFAVFYVLILLVTLVALALLLFLLFCFFWTARMVLGALIRTIQITRFEGLLLIVGSIMFVVSKYLQLLAT